MLRISLMNLSKKLMKTEIRRENDEEHDDDDVNKMKKNNGNKRSG